MYEHRTEPLLPRRKFLRRLAMHGLAAGGMVAVSLSLGILGYHFLAGLSWIDALLNASMIFTGEGPGDPMPSRVAKLVASFYAVFSGVVFLAIWSILVVPVAHRLLHKLHLGGKEPRWSPKTTLPRFVFFRSPRARAPSSPSRMQPSLSNSSGNPPATAPHAS